MLKHKTWVNWQRKNIYLRNLYCFHIEFCWRLGFSWFWRRGRRIIWNKWVVRYHNEIWYCCKNSKCWCQCFILTTKYGFWLHHESLQWCFESLEIKIGSENHWIKNRMDYKCCNIDDEFELCSCSSWRELRTYAWRPSLSQNNLMSKVDKWFAKRRNS